MKEVRVGQIFEYSCEDGYIMEDGNLRQACLKNGQLTGEPPTCVGELHVVHILLIYLSVIRGQMYYKIKIYMH